MAALSILEQVAKELTRPARLGNICVHAGRCAGIRTHSSLQPHFDYHGIKSNAQYIASNISLRKSRGQVDAVISMHTRYAELLREVDALRNERNQLANDKGMRIEEKQAAGRRIKDKLGAFEVTLAEMKLKLQSVAMQLPCDTHPDAPIGPESMARQILTIGQPRQFDFAPRDHVTLGQSLGLFDSEAASTITGSAFSVLTGPGALLELALVHWAMGQAAAAGFVPVLPPDLAHIGLVEGCGFNPRDEEGEGGLSQVYRLAGSDLCLIGTAEIPLAGLHAGQLLQAGDLPKAYAAFSHCFRREAGGAGAGRRGLYRLHQFSKVELFALMGNGHAPAPGSPFHPQNIVHRELLGALVAQSPRDSEAGLAGPTPPVSSSDTALACLVDFQARLLTQLGLHARVLDMPTEELGAAAYRKVDCEAWMPGRLVPGATPGSALVGCYGEVTSASNCMDYQSRRLNIRVKREQGVGVPGHAQYASTSGKVAVGGAVESRAAPPASSFVHTLNGTALAVPRIIIALLETHQQKDGSVNLPACLVPYMHGQTVLKPLLAGKA